MRNGPIVMVILLAAVWSGGAAAGPADCRRRACAQVVDAPTPEDVAVEVRVGREVAGRILSRHPLVEDPGLQRYVDLVGQSLALAAPRGELVFRFAVIDAPGVNAYSTPGGYVMVTREALGVMRDEAELAGVLAHEIGHVVAGHVVKDLRLTGRSQGLWASLLRLVGGGASAGEVGLREATDTVMERLFNRGYRVEEELEADRLAVTLASAAGYEAEGLGRFLERVAETRGAKSPTHPPTAERLAWLRDLIEESGCGGHGHRGSGRFSRNVHASR
ncbi:MAG: M48 family metalloprotease [Deltaproteobacteria bacterium]|nr:M48 family metalloprotease [Deltaproteobacteria bacterium]